MQIRPIKTRADHRAALKEIEGLIDATPGTSAGDRLDVLVTPVERYESQQGPIAPPTQSRRCSTTWRVADCHDGIWSPTSAAALASLRS